MVNKTALAIILRRVHYGDYDLIVTFFSREAGKIATIAKSAKKSVKRFPGALELFSVSKIVFTDGKGTKPSYLKEAAVQRPFANIRADIKKMAYASYWSELVDRWMKERTQDPQMYQLLYFALHELNDGYVSPEVMSILFQMKFSALVGFCPNFSQCVQCGIQLEKMGKEEIRFDFVRGGVICSRCAGNHVSSISLSMGTIKRLQWIENGDLACAKRVKFSFQPLQEGLTLFETFLPFQLNNKPRSLKFLRQIR
jgi:DNA repair protein RecO (recombination protein O)